MKKIIYLSIFSLTLFLAAGCTKRDNNASTENGNAPAVAKDRTDTGITTEVKLKITDDDLLDGTDISVDTDHGVVNLTGTVTNQAQKERAKEIATKVEGVQTVQDNLQIGEPKSVNLDDEKNKVDNTVDEGKDLAEKTGNEAKDLTDKTGDKTKDMAHKAGTAVNDASITAEIKMKLAGDDVTDALDINVDTNNGVVTLKGNVKNQAEADRAIQLARSVEDVKNVHSDLKIHPER